MTKIEVKVAKKYGRGLYATKNIKKGEIVESSPVIEVSGLDVTQTTLNMYVFEWKQGSSAIALGLGSLFNHSNHTNVTYALFFGNKTIVFIATKDIKKGSQLFINYGYDPKRGIEVAERNIYQKLKNKFESPSYVVEYAVGKDKDEEKDSDKKYTMNKEKQDECN